MSGRLDGFLRSARKRVAAGAYPMDGEALRRPASFSQALGPDGHGGPAIVAEVKPKSPSEGRLTDRPLDTLAALAAEAPAAFSILTDADHFGGDLGLLRAAHGHGRPVLMKDFIVDVAQLDAATHHGAAAVLLIERALDTKDRDALIQAAHDRGLEVLLEVHGVAEAARAVASDADVLGVNARDLDTLDVDLGGAAAALADLQDGDRPTLHLSGVRDRRDRLDAGRAGADGVLVGTQLCRSPDPGLALRALRRPLAKVCGLTHEDDVVDAARAGADLLGFIVMSSSERSLSPADAASMAEAVRDLAPGAGGPTHEAAEARTVLVTTRRDVAQAAAWASAAPHDWVQAGGFPDAPATHAAFARHGIGWFAVCAPGASSDHADGLVVDTPGGRGGGTGRTHDWSLTARSMAGRRGALCLVAGGLDADNVAAAIGATGATGADASSRLEGRGLRKDPAAVQAYVEAIHALGRAEAGA